MPLCEQLELGAPAETPTPDEVEEFVHLLRGRDWRLAVDVLHALGHPVNDAARRRLRKLAEHSGGRIAGGQQGYKLVEEMTAEEFGHFERWMASQENKMKARRVEAQRVFYGRTRV